MPKLKENAIPTYREHASGNAIVVLAGRTHYLGTHGSQASRKAYDKAVGEWIASGRPRAPIAPPKGDATVTELILKYVEHMRTYYAGPHVENHLQHHRVALKIVRTLYGPTPAREFGPLALMTTRQNFIAAGWNRTYCNNQTARVRRMFQWAVSQEIIPPNDKINALASVENLHKGKSAAPEPRKVLPVSDKHIEQAIACASDEVGAMLQLQRITGMRPGEVCKMKVGDIIRGKKGEAWIYRMTSHKTEAHGVSGDIYLGPKAQALIKPFLTLDPAAHLFRPSVALAKIREERTAERDKNGTPKGQGNAPGTNTVRRPKKVPGDFYTVPSYRRAIAYACAAAFPLPAKLAARMLKRSRAHGTFESKASWEARMTPDQKAAAAEAAQWRKEHQFHPHQVRHTAATEIRATHGTEIAQVLLRHKSLSATQIYAEKNVEAARKLAGEVG